MAFTFGSLFSGIGGIDLGLERAGMTCRWQVEIDDYCRRVLAKHWPDTPRYGDIRQLTGDELEPVDMLAGGFPCQDVSLAGKRAGLDGERSGLWWEYARLVRILRPRYVLVENVPGLLHRGMGDVLGELARLGYDAEWESLPAAAFGAPHIRERVLIVAHSNGTGREELRGAIPVSAQLTAAECGSDPLADSESVCGQLRSSASGRPGGFAGSSDAIRDSDKGRCRRWTGVFGPRGRTQPASAGWWTTEPSVGRVANGVPSRVDRLRGLGNAVVPQVAEWIGRRILEVEACQ